MLTSPEGISDNFAKYHHCKNLKFENFDESKTENGESRDAFNIIAARLSYVEKSY
jgi:hypothetical protein